MKLYENWLPLRNEDAQTALVFGALRHVPVGRGLQPWLSTILNRPVEADPLEVENFWPRLPSIVDGSTTTEPELVFEVDDGEPLLVVVENKPGHGGHTVEQISREAVDAAKQSGSGRLALVMVGGDIGPPMHLSAWRAETIARLQEYGLSDVEFELYYSSWAAIGQVLNECAEREPVWARYIEDALAQLRFNALLGYNGAPMFDDLEGMTVPNVVEGYNRTILAVRQFFLTVQGQSRFRDLGITGGQDLQKDGGSKRLTQPEDWFRVSAAICTYRSPLWPANVGVFLGFYFWTEEDAAEICAGAFCSQSGQNLPYAFAGAGEPDETSGIPKELDTLDKKFFPFVAGDPDSFWVYGTRPWKTGAAAEDVAWAIDHLAVAADGIAKQ